MNLPNLFERRRTLGLAAIPHETQYTIAEWNKATFGARSPLDIAKRAEKEFNEMLSALQRVETARKDGEPDSTLRSYSADAAMEAADVVIMLMSVVNGLKCDLLRLVDVKMGVNRKREWHHDPVSGSSRHVGSDAKPGELLDRRPDFFVEPGSGLRMQRDRWYILSDSGAAYASTGFESAEAARVWFSSPAAVQLYGGELKLAEPSYLPYTEGGTAGWDDRWEAANVLFAGDLFNFWAATDEAELSALNPELFA